MIMLRIVHVNLFDAKGGAARIAWQIMNSMTAQGHDVHVFAHHKTTNDPRVIPIVAPQIGWQSMLLKQQAQQGLFDLYSAALLDVIRHPLFEQADIVHLHCINGGYFSFLLLPFLAAKPLVWTLHDPLAFTAGCYNTEDCNGWQNDWCTACPLDSQVFGQRPQRELIQLIKGSIYKIAKFTAVCPSVWLEKQARNSILRDHNIRTIHNGIDIDTFRPGNRLELREKLRLPVEKKIIMFAAHGGFNDQRKGGRFLIEALKKIQCPDALLLNIGTADNSVLDELPIPHIDVPFIDDQRLMADYYGAADLYVSPALAEVFGLTVCEAQSCGIPVVAFATGGIPEIVVHQQTGYLVDRGNSDGLASGISTFLNDSDKRRLAGEAARRRMVEQFSVTRMVDDYTRLYQEILSAKTWSIASCFPVLQKENMLQFIEKAKTTGGWGNVWQEFRNLYSRYGSYPASQRAVFTDQFYCCCLSMADVVAENWILWEIIEQWVTYRKMTMQCGALPQEEMQELLRFSRQLREQLVHYFTQTPLDELVKIGKREERLLITVWWQLFFNSFLPLNSSVGTQVNSDSLGNFNSIATDSISRYIRIMLESMYHPYAAETYNIHATELWNESKVPLYPKAILSLWMLHVPYYNIEEGHRQQLLRYAPELCRISMPSEFFISIVNKLVDGFWRVSYVGGNNLSALTALGNFISLHMARFSLQNMESSFQHRMHRKEGKLRVGYISRFFRNQAVSYYMVNRIIHHDKDKFEITIFSLGDHCDAMTEIFKEYSDKFLQYTNLADVSGIAKGIMDSKLDVLIYTDIGMDPATYLLAGMQLAPVQCAMVGHGTTTGLPTIQYYISGDFEPDNAESHYREKLIKLPNLGAAQYPPPFKQDKISTRNDWKIPNDAVVFVSCANGIKHGPQRDTLLVDILKKAPNACILLKPCYSSNLDSRISERIINAVEKAGVGNRLFIVPPLNDVSALLSIADIQLDTYPYGGWTTNMEALYMGLPIITQEGDMARSRWGAHMLRALGIQEGIAANEIEYVDWAVRFALDSELRNRVKSQIKERAIILFDGAAAQPEYEKVLLTIYQEYENKV
jgi:predicted O-linked N-acetylglucosamine transferase (SPINDLY family)/glycosyltransferase involved in cell wall biosynthesis